MTTRRPNEERPSSYCTEQVRRHDSDRYLTVLFAPKDRREDLFALYAFNLEVAKTAEVVSETLLGHMRLQWWREAIEGIYAGRPAAHEVVGPLARAVERHGLRRTRFDTLIEARAGDLEDRGPSTLAELEDYAEATSASLSALALDVLGARGEAADAAARHVGIAWALVGLLRAVPFHAHHRRLYLPGNLVQRHGVHVTDLFELCPSPGLAAVVETVAGKASEHLREARALAPRVPAEARPALLPATLASRALVTLAKARYDPFDARVQAPQTGRAWRLWWANLRRRY